MDLNYAKNKAGELIFFTPPELPKLPEGSSRANWWLWSRPHGPGWSQFRLIGETTDQWCAASGHMLNACGKCRGLKERDN